MAGNFVKSGKPFVEECKRLGVKGQRDRFLQEVRNYVPDGPRTAWEKNPARNRYKDIMCLDKTRVKLKNTENDYMHASWVLADERLFICSQAPTQATAELFWQLVLSERSPAIVMLCDFRECGSEKCFEYYSVNIGDMCLGEVRIRTLTSERVLNRRVIRSQLEISVPTGEVHTLTHYKLDGWLDHCAPDDAKTVLRLVAEVAGIASEAPILTHCSAGVGRTMAFVGVFRCVEVLRSGAPFDLAQVVRKLREERVHAIQSDLQYLFLVRAVLETLSEKKDFKVFDASERWYKEFVDSYIAFTTKKRKIIEESMTKKHSPKCAQPEQQPVNLFGNLNLELQTKTNNNNNLNDNIANNSSKNPKDN